MGIDDDLKSHLRPTFDNQSVYEGGNYTLTVSEGEGMEAQQAVFDIMFRVDGTYGAQPVFIISAGLNSTTGIDSADNGDKLILKALNLIFMGIRITAPLVRTSTSLVCSQARSVPMMVELLLFSDVSPVTEAIQDPIQRLVPFGPPLRSAILNATSIAGRANGSIIATYRPTLVPGSNDPEPQGVLTVHNGTDAVVAVDATIMRHQGTRDAASISLPQCLSYLQDASTGTASMGRAGISLDLGVLSECQGRVVMGPSGAAMGTTVASARLGLEELTDIILVPYRPVVLGADSDACIQAVAFGADSDSWNTTTNSTVTVTV